jgi:hypothetical protein
MNRYGTIAVLASVLALATANLRAELTVTGTAADPYSPIAARNVFGLTPLSQNPLSQEQRNTATPPKITLTGITTIFGPAVALYKVAGSQQDGNQRQDKSYILNPGQEQDGVAVVAIDTEKAIVTFNNHGVRQDIALPNEPAAGEKRFAATLAKGRPNGGKPKPARNNPKPGDYNYADQKTVTAPLPPIENPESAIDAQSAIYGGGIGGDTPPGHGGL